MFQAPRRPTSSSTITSAWGVNARGQIAGVAIVTPATPSYHTWLWDGVQMIDLGTSPSCCTAAINDPGQVMAESFVWDNGTVTPLSLYPIAMNNGGVVTGGRSVDREVDHAFVWENGQLWDLGAGSPTWANPSSSIPSAINAAGNVAGWFGAEGVDPEPRHAALWRLVAP